MRKKAKTKTKKRQRLGVGFIWFSGQWHGHREGYTDVCLTEGPDGQDGRTRIRVGKLGGWQKVKLYAEWTS